jgi:copper(I)-binding protein
VLTLVDAFYDRQMRDFIAVDPGRIAALAAASGFTLQVEDPFTLWTLGPDRYATMAADYAALVAPGQQLTVDINVVEREGDVFPTAKQTGVELFQLASAARRHFDGVCFYSEATIPTVDRGLLHNALAAGSTVQWRSATEVEIDSGGTVELDTGGYHAATVDGRDWPAGHGAQLILPRGKHRVAWLPGEINGEGSPIRGFTGAILVKAAMDGNALVVEYEARGRAYLELAFHPGRIVLDGQQFPAATLRSGETEVLVLPGGKHEVRLGPASN